ncbi:MAG: site-specific DNA-methyltransferase [Gemmatimonadales bacterium]
MMRKNSGQSAKVEQSHSDKATITVSQSWTVNGDVTIHQGDCRDLLAQIPNDAVQLIVTSPPYNIGKKYEKRVQLDDYLRGKREVINLCIDKLAAGGSICWQVGNHVDDGEVYPLDTLLYPFFKERGLRLRNRIIWHFEHGLHSSRRFSGRYETILWFTKDDGQGNYVFNLDPVRVPQKYPGKKAYKGPRKGQNTSHPLGKNPGDVWIIPNVKHNHVEKTIHPCQFPVELVERLVLALTNPGDVVLDPYMGVGSALAAAVMRGRRAAGAELIPEYVTIARERIEQAAAGTLLVRPRTRPVYEPPKNSPLTKKPWDEPGSLFG